jgi:tetratricopeptide (TPR) repeat protein
MNYSQKNEASKADLIFQKAYMAHHAGKLEDAEALYRKALRKTPSDMETLYLLGTVCSQLGKFEEAAQHLKKALQIAPDHVETLNSMGLTLIGQRSHEEAEACYRRALILRPDFADAHSNMGSVLELLGRLDEAEPHLRRALELNPNLPNAHYILGLVLKGKDRFEEAVQCFLRGLELRPDFSVAYDDLGGIYKIWGRPEQAMACFEHALKLSPKSASAHNNLGTVYEELNRLDEALVEYETAVALNPDISTPRWNQAYLFLRQGILDRGWEAHELRFKGGHIFKRFPYAEWDGSSLEGKTILVYAEQGLGDEIFFASCIPDLIAKARHCVIECEVRLAPLFARSFPSATVQGGKRDQIGWITDVPKIDVQSAAGSLPRFLRPTLESFPDTPAYLVAAPERVEYWRSRLALLGHGMKVGICWRSGNTTGERHKQYSLLKQWGNIFNVPGVHFVNLQYDECSEELREVEELFGVRIANFSEIDLRNDIDDSAALMKSLDLVISAATAVGEIAGSIGVDVFRLDIFGKAMDALGTGELPWHRATRLFGQLSLEDWDTPLALVAAAVQEKAHGMANAVEYVHLPAGVEIAVNGSLEDIPTYILKEQLGWFDPEYQFVVGIAQPGMKVIDAGAGVGTYAIPLAKATSGGTLWALTQTVAETNLLMKSRARNRFEQCMNVAIVDQGLSLDSEMDKHGFEDIAFVRVAIELCTSDFIDRSVRFFSKNSPLLMFGIRPGVNFSIGVAERLMLNHYRLYRLIPGLNLLVPFTAQDELDAYSLNLFACKDDRAEVLERQGILIRQVPSLTNLPGIDQAHWQDYLTKLPYSQDMLATWFSKGKNHKDWEVYWMALNLFALAKSGSQSGGDRYACLQMAQGVMAALVQDQANLPRLLTLCRILTDLGRREAAVGILNQICSMLHSGVSLSIDEPFCALTEFFAGMNPGNKMAEWIVMTVLRQRENLRAFSNFFTGQESLAVLNEIQAAGFANAEVDRHIALIKMRFGIA